jgi:sulfite exporter TauE/SafE
MCGPLALALPSTGGNPVSYATGRLAYNFGRVLTYCLLGILLGAFGHTLALAGVQRWTSIALGAALLIGLLASRTLLRWQPMTPLVNVLKVNMAGLLGKRSLRSLALLGSLNGLLPCGLVYVAGAGATATGSIVTGVGYMAAFGAGTIPMMLTIGLSGRLIPVSVRLKLARAIPVSIFLLGTLLILRGMSLGIPYLSPDLAHGACCGR